MTENAPSFPSSLRKKYGSKLANEVDSFPNYFKDASEIIGKPSAIFFAESEIDIIEIITDCRKNKIPIVFRGAGTGYTGGAVPISNSLVLSLERLKKLEVDPERKLAFCGPGVITIDLMKQAEKHNLFYPPDPASYDESTLGGNVAECAGGLHCKKYGVTKDYIIGLRGITAGGEIIKTGIYSEGDLFNLSGIMIGSEGMLIAITEIAVRLIDRPQPGLTILAAFETTENAARSVAAITQSGIVPSVMEFMDGDAMACSNEYERVIDIDRAGALLLFETSGQDGSRQAEQISAICRNFHAIYLKNENNLEKAETLWKIRRNLSKAVKASASRKIAEDICVPPSKLPELVNFVAQLDKEYPMRINSYGHAGDGNLHVNFLAKEQSGFEDQFIDEGINRLFAKTLELGGTLSGEHGIGLTKKDFLHLEFDSPTLEFMRGIKKVFDPEGLLNPGKMFA